MDRTVQLVVAVITQPPVAPGLRPADEDPSAEAQALFEEARRRTRRRHARRFTAVATVVSAAIVIHALGVGTAPRSSASAAINPAVDRGAFAGHGELAFISRGRLFVLDGASGRLSVLTGPSRQASDPQFSPDGRWLSYSVAQGAGAAPQQSWVARSNGGSPRLVATGFGVTGWLPDGQLVAQSGLWRLSPDGALARAGTPPAGLAAWAPGGGRYVFIVGGLGKGPPKPSSGVERLEVARSLKGRRTTWFATPIAFGDHGVQGAFLEDVVVLPGKAGILFRVDPEQSGSLAAEGTAVYEITSPGTRPRSLGIVVADPVTVGADGSFAFTDGGNRYAWMTKNVALCSASGHCSRVRSPAGTLSVNPALSPRADALAFVEAASSSEETYIGQAAIARWYATHSLWILSRGDTRPTQIAGTAGAASPVWSADGRSLLYVAGDALWLLPTVTAKPVRIASPLFAPNDWQSFYGEVAWPGQFAWRSQAPR